VNNGTIDMEKVRQGDPVAFRDLFTQLC
jgi:hypothetical protein